MMFRYILAELPERSRRRIRTVGNHVVTVGPSTAYAYGAKQITVTTAGGRAIHYPVIIPLPVKSPTLPSSVANERITP